MEGLETLLSSPLRLHALPRQSACPPFEKPPLLSPTLLPLEGTSLVRAGVLGSSLGSGKGLGPREAVRKIYIEGMS